MGTCLAKIRLPKPAQIQPNGRRSHNLCTQCQFYQYSTRDCHQLDLIPCTCWCTCKNFQRTHPQYSEGYWGGWSLVRLLIWQTDLWIPASHPLNTRPPLCNILMYMVLNILHILTEFRSSQRGHITNSNFRALNKNI